MQCQGAVGGTYSRRRHVLFVEAFYFRCDIEETLSTQEKGISCSPDAAIHARRTMRRGMPIASILSLLVSVAVAETPAAAG